MKTAHEKYVEELELLRDEVDAFTKHVGASTFREARDVLFRSHAQTHDQVGEMFIKIKEMGSKIATARKLWEAFDKRASRWDQDKDNETGQFIATEIRTVNNAYLEVLGSPEVK